jgi:hypothetical protein
MIPWVTAPASQQSSRINSCNISRRGLWQLSKKKMQIDTITGFWWSSRCFNHSSRLLHGKQASYCRCDGRVVPTKTNFQQCLNV